MNEYFFDSFKKTTLPKVHVEGTWIKHLSQIDYVFKGYHVDDFDEEEEIGRAEVLIIEDLKEYLLKNETDPSSLFYALSSVRGGVDIDIGEAYYFWKKVQELEKSGDLDNEELINSGYMVAGKIAFISLFEIYENYQKDGNGKKSLAALLEDLKKELLVDFVLLYPYPYRLENAESFDPSVHFSVEKLQSFYKDFDFKVTRGSAQTKNGEPMYHMVLKTY